ncbi:MAG: ABC transporter permease [Saprospiraceae bacterium]|nr:ABC transporter permease [Saprospiraceae bacterium]
MIKSYINTAIENKTSHVQIHDPKFLEDYEIQYALKNYTAFREKLKETGIVSASSPRIIVGGLIASASGNRGALIKAIDPALEIQTTGFDKKVVVGFYLNIEKRNPLLMSKGLGKKLGVSLHQHVVLSFQDTKGEFVSGRFKVVGWFDTRNVKTDDAMVYVRMADLTELTGLPVLSFHEMAVKFSDINFLDKGQKKLKEIFPNTIIRNYKEISPDLALYTGQIKIALTIIIIIIMIALLFGIINTMLMAVLERQKELGMLMAIGMNRLNIFGMIMTETLILCLFAAPLGVLLGHITVRSLAKTGIDLSIWSDALAQFGMDAIIFPYLDVFLYRDIVTALMITALVAGLYPAMRAVSTSPAAAMRKL